MADPGVLFVDDEEWYVEEFQLCFKDQAIDIYTANNVEAALELLKQHRDEIMVVVSDFNMPLTNGLELLSRVREMAPTLSRIMVTSAKEVEVAQGAINTGAVLNFFHKPWSEPELIQAVQSAIEEYQRQCLLQRLNEQFTELEQSNYLLKLIDIFQRELSNNQIAMSSLLMTLTDSTLQSHLDNNAGTINCLEWAIYYNELIQCLSESMSLYIAIREHLFQPLQDTFNVETLFHQCQNQLPLENTALSLVLMDSTANCQITADLNTLVKSIRCLTLFLTTQHLLVNQLECKVIEDRGHRRVQLSLIPNQQHPLPEKAILSPTTKPIEAMSVDDFHGCSFMMYVTRLAIEEMNGSLDYVDYRFVILLPL